MNNYELYIDDILIELDSKFNLPLVYQSPVFTDISKIQSNYSLTVRLPKTTNNLRAIKNCQMPDNTTPFPYKNHAVEVFRNGISIIQNGTMILFSISDSIEISISFGKIDAYKLKEKKLRELNGNDFVWWLSTGNNITESNKQYGFANSDFGLNSSDYHYRHPFVSCDWLINKISQDCNISIVFPNSVLAEKEKLYIPLIDKNPDQTTFDANTSTFSIDTNLNVIEITDPLEMISGNTFTVKEDGDVYFRGSWDIVIEIPINRQWYFRLHFYINGEEDHFLQTNALQYQQNQYLGVFNFTKENALLQVKKDDIITIRLEYLSSNPPFQLFPQNILSSSGTLSIVPETKYVNYGSKYPIIPNLPEISCLDLIKDIMSLLGLFAYTKNGILFLFSVDEIYHRKSIAKNWTDKLITGNIFDSIEYTFQDYAQNNYLRYLKDDTVKTNADGAIVVYNETLGSEKNIIELKFAASDRRADKIYIPIYEIDQDGNVNYKKTTNRIASVNFGPASSDATFPDTLYFSGENGIISRRYERYQKILSHPKVMTGTFLLNGLDLYNIDLLIPIYLEQAGNYYAIIDI
jgi:hypothetical protein